MEWPPKSDKRQSFPEVDRAEWFDLTLAGKKGLASQRALLDRVDQAIVQTANRRSGFVNLQRCVIAQLDEDQQGKLLRHLRNIAQLFGTLRSTLTVLPKDGQ
jgi:predicted NUDIX family NTP pyrophosphohydrolase